jgi:hypothetical protein
MSPTDRRSNALMRLLARWRADEEGAIAVAFALLLIPIIALAGAAIEQQRAASLGEEMRSGLDSAILAAVQEATPPQRVAAAERIFAATTQRLGIADVKAEFHADEKGRLAGSATGKAPTALLKIVRVDGLAIAAKAEAMGAPTAPKIPPHAQARAMRCDLADGYTHDGRRVTSVLAQALGVPESQILELVRQCRAEMAKQGAHMAGRPRLTR